MKLTDKVFLENKTWIDQIASYSISMYKSQRRFDIDDLKSVAYIAFAESYESWDSTKTASLKTYARNYIINKITTFCSTNLFTLHANYENLKKDPEKLAAVVDAEKHVKYIKLTGTDRRGGNLNADGFQDIKCEDPIDVLIQKETIQLVHDQVEKLSAIEKMIIREKFVNCKPSGEIGNILGISRKTVDTKLKNIYEKLQLCLSPSK